jgi:hypothetical protein
MPTLEQVSNGEIEEMDLEEYDQSTLTDIDCLDYLQQLVNLARAGATVQTKVDKDMFAAIMDAGSKVYATANINAVERRRVALQEKDFESKQKYFDEKRERGEPIGGSGNKSQSFDVDSGTKHPNEVIAAYLIQKYHAKIAEKGEVDNGKPTRYSITDEYLLKPLGKKGITEEDINAFCNTMEDEDIGEGLKLKVDISEKQGKVSTWLNVSK